MKKYVPSLKKGMIISGMVLIVILGIIIINHKSIKKYKSLTLTYNVLEKKQAYVLDETEELKEVDYFLDKYSDEINFLADVFQIKRDTLLIKINQDYDKIISMDSNNIEKNLIDYLLELEKSESYLFNNKVIPCNKSKDYMVSLISYYSNIYSDVDFLTAAAIAKVESNYTSSYMLKKNNIFGGMSGGRLISYKNIEYGILRYIKLLSDKYYSKGITSIEDISYSYNPTYNENGVKIANNTWSANVSKAKEIFLEYKNITNLDELLAIEEQ